MSVTQESSQGDAGKPLQMKDTPKVAGTLVIGGLPQGWDTFWMVLPQGIVR